MLKIKINFSKFVVYLFLTRRIHTSTKTPGRSKTSFSFASRLNRKTSSLSWNQRTRDIVSGSWRALTGSNEQLRSADRPSATDGTSSVTFRRSASQCAVKDPTNRKKIRLPYWFEAQNGVLVYDCINIKRLVARNLVRNCFVRWTN